MARARGANAVMAMATETTYGTPPVSGYKKLPFITSQLGAEQPLLESDLLGLGRKPADPTYDVITNDGDLSVPLDDTGIGFWLSLLLGAPTTSGSGPYLHFFDSGAAVLPSASIEIGHPDRPSYSTHYGVKANSLQIAMQRGGLTSATVGLIGKGETVLGATSTAGVPASLGPINRFAQATGQIQVNGQPHGEIVRANFAYSNNLEKIETIAPNGEITGADPGMPTCTVGLTANFADMSLLTAATSKTPVSLILQWTAGASSFALVLARVFLPRVKRPVQGPNGIQIDLSGQAVQGLADPMLQARLTNGLPSYA